MDYTKNHHLPQWELTDRVLMEDFNQMCADIESGLNATGAAATSSLNAAAALEVNRMRKLGYDLCQVNAKLLAGGAAAGRTKCLACNGLVTEEDQSKTSGFRFAPDRHGAQLGPQTMLTPEKLSSEIFESTIVPKATENGRASHAVKFHSSQTGTITQLQLWVRNSNHYVLFYITIMCQDMDTGNQVYFRQSIQVPSQLTEYAHHTVDVSIPLTAGHNYSLETYSTSTYFTGTIGFGDETQPAFVGSADSELLSSGAIQDSLVLDIPAQMAMAVVHYTGTATAPAVSVGGKTLTAQYTRQGTSPLGESCTEREYYLAGSWSGTVPLAVSCQATSQDLTVYDVEFCLI